MKSTFSLLHSMFSHCFRIYSPVLLSLAFAFASAPAVAGENQIVNPGLEDQDDSWSVFIPEESLSKNCEFLLSQDSPHSGKFCAQLKSADFARFSIAPKRVGDAIRPGDRCRLTFWIRADKDLQTKTNPAFIVRIFLLDQDGQQFNDAGAIFIGLNGKTSLQSPQAGVDLSDFEDPLPAKWKKIESVFEIPADVGADRLGRPEFFATYTLGSIYLDDVVLERVPKNTPLSPSAKIPKR